MGALFKSVYLNLFFINESLLLDDAKTLFSSELTV